MARCRGMGELMKALGLAGGLVGALALSATLVHVAYAEDIVEMISKYRQQHGLSAVKVDPELTKVAERQAKAMADTGIMDHSVAGSFASRISGAHTGAAAENIAAGTKTWAETFRAWQTSPGHNTNLLQPQADSIGVAVARNDQTQYKTFWALVIAEKLPKTKDRKGAAKGGAGSENPIATVKSFVCKFWC